MNIDANLVIQKLMRQIGDLSLQVAILQTQVEMLTKKPEQYVTPNTQPTSKQDNKPTTQSGIEPNAENMSE